MNKLNKKENFADELLLYVKSRASIIEIVTSEIERVHGDANYVATKLGWNWYDWNILDGLRQFDPETRNLKQISNVTDSSGLFEEILPEHNGIFVVENLLETNNSCSIQLIQRLKNFYRQRHPNKVLILVQPVKVLPPELEKEIVLLDLPLPNKADIQVILENVCEDKKISIPRDEETKDKVLSAALGLTIMECEFAYRKAIEKEGNVSESSISSIIQEKESIIKKSGILEYFHPQENMDNVGGLDVLKSWLKKRGKAFGKGASDFGLDTPRGILLLGIPGTGKSLSAKAIANEWQLPLLRLDIGKVYAGIVGASEENMRNALKQAEALAPCILWVDEIEKGLSGTQSSGTSDGGTGSRVFGTFLTWMQEKTKPVFVVATANDISQLPPELLRKGRVDEIFFVDLPFKEARKEIFSICLKRKKRDPKDFDLDKLANESKGFSGAEIEEAVKEGLFTAFDKGELLKDEHILEALRKTYPLSKTMSEGIRNLRAWAKARAVYASSEEAENLEDKEQTSVPKLKQEFYNNPFIK